MRGNTAGIVLGTLGITNTCLMIFLKLLFLGHRPIDFPIFPINFVTKLEGVIRFENIYLKNSCK